MDKIYEFSCKKGRTIRITDIGVDTDLAASIVHRRARFDIEKHVDSQMFADQKVYFEDKKKAESYVPAWLDILQKTKKVRIESDNETKEFLFTVIDIYSTSTDYEDNVDGSSGVLNLVRVTVVDDTNEDNYVCKPILVLYYEYEITEKEVINY